MIEAMRQKDKGKENELLAGNILAELENDFLNDGFTQVSGTYHKKSLIKFIST